jgi:prefoldin subunit 5
MSKSLVERKIDDAIDTLDSIHRKLRSHADLDIQALARKAQSAAQELERAKREMHSHWKTS